MAHSQFNVKWAEGEHIELGETGALQACAEIGLDKKHCPIRNIGRKDEQISFSYGELVSAADFYNEPNDLYNDKTSGISVVIRCAHQMLHDHRVQNPKDGRYRECEMPAFFSMPGYLEVVTQNYNHFGWNNMTAYVLYHQEALLKARTAFTTPKDQHLRAKRLFAQALILNGFADHYLTDAFASGHIRVPRIQVKKWAIENLSGLWKATRGDILTAILHDNESIQLKSGLEQGFLVENSRGDFWRTRGDQHLHIQSDLNDIGFEMPLTALKESFKELLRARQKGIIPEGLFAATEYVPFHHDIPLVEKFSPEIQQLNKKDILQALVSSIPFFERFIFHKSDLEKMLIQLPKILTQFQNDVTQDIRSNPELVRRLPNPYTEAFQKVD